MNKDYFKNLLLYFLIVVGVYCFFVYVEHTTPTNALAIVGFFAVVLLGHMIAKYWMKTK